MQSSTLERLQLQVADLQHRIAARTPTTYRPGQRVLFKFGADADDVHATFDRVTVDRDGEPAGVLWLIGYGAFHVEPLANLRPACGKCGDCMHLNQRPGCAE